MLFGQFVRLSDLSAQCKPAAVRVLNDFPLETARRLAVFRHFELTSEAWCLGTPRWTVDSITIALLTGVSFH
jgi:hypothetical protein